MSSIKKLPVKGLCGRCLSVGGPDPYTPLTLHTVYVYTIYFIYTGKGGELNQRGGGGGGNS
jgi:hypothetical protein